MTTTVLRPNLDERTVAQLWSFVGCCESLVNDPENPDALVRQAVGQFAASTRGLLVHGWQDHGRDFLATMEAIAAEIAAAGERARAERAAATAAA